MIDFECNCGNPDCHSEMMVRVGYVHIRHPDGSKEERWDYLYIDANRYDPKTETATWIEMMYSPDDAKALMWLLITHYFPGLRFIFRKFERVHYHFINLWWKAKRNSP